MLSLSRLLRASGDDSAWLPPVCAPHLWSLELRGFDDCLDADALWDAITGDQPAVIEVGSGDSQRRLHCALNDHRRKVKKRLSNGKLVEQGQVFTDVVIEVPRAHWNDALRLAADRLEIFIHNLEQRHARDFADILPASRPPRYVAIASDQLAADRVRCHFGYGVYVPGPDEQSLLEFSIASGDAGVASHSFEPWAWFEDGRRRQQAVALYPDQDAQVLCPGWPLAPPQWFSGDSGYLLLRRDAMGGWTGFGDDRHTRFAHTIPASRERGPRLVFESLVNVDDAPLVVELHAPETLDDGFAAGTLTPAAAPLPGLVPYALWLEGFVLPGPSAALPPGLTGWTLWLDEHGNPAAPDRLPQQQAALAALRFDGNGLALRPPGGAFVPVADDYPQYLRFGPGGIELDSPLLDGGQPLLRLPQALRLPLEQQRLSLGRFDASRAAGGAAADGQADLLLDLLDQPGSLQWSGRDRLGSLGSIGLSRHHLDLELRDDALLLEAVSSGPVLLYERDGSAIGPLKPADAAAGGLPASLQPGQLLQVGCYLLRFDHDR